MSIDAHLSDHEALERLQQQHPELRTVTQIARMTEAAFVTRYASDPCFHADPHQVHRVYMLAVAMNTRNTLLWANIKDTVAAPHYRAALFNNISQEFFQHVANTPGYQDVFGSLDSSEPQPHRSIVGPAAYFVDLMRFIDDFVAHNQHASEALLLDGRPGQRRRPDLFTLPFDSASSLDVVPAIDLVNEVLEAIVQSEDTPDTFRLLEHMDVPSSLPFNRPLAELRAYLAHLGTSLHAIYQAYQRLQSEAPFRQHAIDRELLELSPREYDLITQEATPSDIERRYGHYTLAQLSCLPIFLDQTGLNRQEVNELLYQHLDRSAINAGLTRLFFINTAADGLGPLLLVDGAHETHSLHDQRLINLSFAKLDRIYRFVKLARTLGWSFTELDLALRSLHPAFEPERTLRFDGIDDYVACRQATSLDLETFTIEAWVYPDTYGASPIVCKGRVSDSTASFLLMLNPDGKLALFVSDDGLSEIVVGAAVVPLTCYSHVAVTVDGAQVCFYLDGQRDVTRTLERLRGVRPFGDDLEIGRNLADACFAGCMREVRMWAGVRSQDAIADNRYRRMTGREPGLVGYWPLTENPWGILFDRTPNRNDGVFGGGERATQPRWVQRDLVLDDTPEPVSHTAYAFNGTDQYLAARGVAISTFRALTLEAWVRWEPQLHTGGMEVIALGSEADGTAQFRLWIDAGQICFGGVLLGEDLQSTRQLAPGCFTHVAVVLPDAALAESPISTQRYARIYVNGVPEALPLMASNVLLAPLAQTTPTLSVGRALSPAYHYFHGALKEVRLWECVRSHEHINLHMVRTVETQTPGLVGYWRFDAIEHGQAIDHSPRGHHLTLGGIAADSMPARVPAVRLHPDPPVAVRGVGLSFDGNGSALVVQHPANRGLGSYDQLTLALWFKPQTTDEYERVMLAQGDREAGLVVYLQHDALCVGVWTDSYEHDDFQHILLTTGALDPEQWHHLAITKHQGINAAEYVAYLDGHEFGRQHAPVRLSAVGSLNLGSTGSSQAIWTPQVGMITRDDPGHAVALRPHAFAGLLTDLRIWRVVKTAADLRQVRFVASDAADRDLVAYLPLAEASDQLHDHASTKHTAVYHTCTHVPTIPALGAAYAEAHAHYADAAALHWSQYTYSGRLYIDDSDSAIGVTFLSRYPERIDRYYTLRRDARDRAFGLAVHPANAPAFIGQTNTGVIPHASCWYRFEINVDANATSTRIRTKVWLELDEQPLNYQVDAYDTSDVRIAAGTVGLWATGSGARRFANLQVQIGDAGTQTTLHLLGSGFPDAAWQQTGVRLITTEPLFQTHAVRGRMAYGSDVTRDHVGAYLALPNAAHWTNYEFSGRMLTSSVDGGIGVTFFWHEGAHHEQCYWLACRRASARFVLGATPKGLQRLVGHLDTGVTPTANTWYRFRVTAEALVHETRIRAKVWQEGQEEPQQFQAEAMDASSVRLRGGTIGVWATSAGQKVVDNLLVAEARQDGGALFTVLYSESFQRYNKQAHPHDWREHPAYDYFAPVDELSSVATLVEHTPRWTDSLNYPLLRRPLTPWALRFDGRATYAAAQLDGLAAASLHVAVWVMPAALQASPILSLSLAAAQQPTLHLGLNDEGHVMLRYAGPHGMPETCVSQSRLSPYVFAHVAFSVDNNILTLYLNGREEGRIVVAALGDPGPAIIELGRAPDIHQPATYTFFTGDLRDVRIWSGSWFGEWTTFDRYQRPAPDARLIAYWPLGETSSRIVSDHAPGGTNPLYLGGFVDRRCPVLTTSAPVWQFPTRTDHVRKLDSDVAEQQSATVPQRSDVWSDRGIFDPSAYKFDGQTHYVDAFASAIQPLDAATFEVWIRPDMLEGRVSLWDQPDGAFTIEWQNGQLSLLVAGCEPAVQNFAPHFAIHEWVHIALVYACADLRTQLYINGYLAEERAYTTMAALAPAAARIGQRLDGRGGLRGLLKQMRLWSSARSAEQIATFRFRRLAGDEPQLVLYLPCNQPMQHAHAPIWLQPDLLDVSFAQDFWRPERLAFHSDDTSGMVVWHDPTHGEENAAERRTIEVWFKAEDTYVAARKQVIYHEGDEQHGLSIYLFEGNLYFGGYQLLDDPTNWGHWPGTWLHTRHVRPGRWHHAALVLDGRAHLRVHALRAFLDGTLVDEGPGARLIVRVADIAVCGSGSSIRFHDGTSARIAAHGFPSAPSVATPIRSEAAHVIAMQGRTNPAQAADDNQSDSSGTPAYSVLTAQSNAPPHAGFISTSPQPPMDTRTARVAGAVRNEGEIPRRAPHLTRSVWLDRTARAFDGAPTNARLFPFTDFPRTALTFEGWLKPAGVTHPGTILSYATNGNDDNAFVLYLYGHRSLSVLVNDDLISASGVIELEHDVWQHIAITWRAIDGQLRIYRDGRAVYTGAASPGRAIPGGGSLIIGQEQDQPGGSFDPFQAFYGHLNEVRLWTHVRSPQQIREQMHQHLKDDQPGLVYRWPARTRDKQPNETLDRNTPISTPAAPASVAGVALLRGAVLDVRVWNTARTQRAIQLNRYRQLVGNEPHLVLWWQFEHVVAQRTPDLSGHGHVGVLTTTVHPQPLGHTPPYALPKAALDPAALNGLAAIKRLRETYNQRLDLLISLWHETHHTGTQDRHPLFHDIFNSQDTVLEPWNVSTDEPLRWNSSGTSDQQRSEHMYRCLMRVLGISRDDLISLIATLSGADAPTIVLNGAYLVNLYRLARLPDLLRLNVNEFVHLLKLLDLSTIDSFGRFVEVTERVDWMRATNIDVYELDFLSNDRESVQVHVPYDAQAIRDLADSLRRQSRDFLAQPDSFITTEINARQSAGLFALLRSLDVIDMVGGVDPEYHPPMYFDQLFVLAAGGSTPAADEQRLDLRATAFALCTDDQITALQSQRLIGDNGLARDDSGQVCLSIDGVDFSDQRLKAIFPDANVATLNALRDGLARGLTIQRDIAIKLMRMRDERTRATLTGLATLVGAPRDHTRAVATSVASGMPLKRFFNLVISIRNADDPIPDVLTTRPTGYLYRLSKILYLAAKFNLTLDETRALVTTPAVFSVANIVQPSVADLTSLHLFNKLKSAFPNRQDMLLVVLTANSTDATTILTRVAALTGWETCQIEALQAHFGAELLVNRVEGLERLRTIFAIATALHCDVRFVTQLADINDLSYDCYHHAASNLLDVLRAHYDDEHWIVVQRCIHDRLAVQRRDALLARAMLSLSTECIEQRSPKALSDYLLLDVHVGPEVATSRLVQAIASLQWYVQRCMMNLERGIDPATVPSKAWEWMKNYRVWEAKRKVFLYPENYLRPERRSTRTALFAAFERELMHGDLSKDAVERAYKQYLEAFIALANLKIVGSYLHRATEAQPGSEPKETLYLIGRTRREPRSYYVRQRIDGAGWTDWQHIAISINAEFVTPVYAFNRLLLFWVECTKGTESRKESVDGYRAVVKYSYQTLAGEWVQPQVYVDLRRTLEPYEINRPEWRRVYAQRVHDMALDTCFSIDQHYQATLDQARISDDLRKELLEQHNIALVAGSLSTVTTLTPGVRWRITDSAANQCYMVVKERSDSALLNVYLLEQHVEGCVHVLEVNAATHIEERIPTFHMDSLTWELWTRPARKGPVDSVTAIPVQTVTLLTYDPPLFGLPGKAALQITVTNNVTRHPQAPDIAALKQAVQDRSNEYTIVNGDDTAAQQARTQARKRLDKAEQALKEARSKPQWQSLDLTLAVLMDETTRLSTTISYDTWQHLALTMQHTAGLYTLALTVGSCNRYADTVQTTFPYDLPLAERKPLHIGRTDYADVHAVFALQLSELRLWDYLRDTTTIVRERDERKGQGVVDLALFVLPFDHLLPGATMNLVVSNLCFQLVTYPVPPASRERIVLLWGKEIHRSMGNTFQEDWDFNLSLRALDVDRMPLQYAVELVASHLYISVSKQQRINDYAAGNQTTINCFSPNIRRDTFKVHPGAMRGGNDITNATYLLQGLSTGASSFMDVNNQPGTYILDTTDEQFLVRIRLRDDQQRIKTSAEQLRFSIASDSWRGEYYNNRDLHGIPVLIRTDRAIHFNWSSGSPGPSVHADGFSVRWTRDQQFPGGQYVFTAVADGGVRVYIDDQKELDSWIDSAGDTHTTTVDVTQGWHRLRMEYHKNSGNALATLDWHLLSDGVPILLPEKTPGEPPIRTVNMYVEPDDALNAEPGKHELNDYVVEFERLSTSAICGLSLRLFAGGIDNLLHLDAQHLREIDFQKRYAPHQSLVMPPGFDPAIGAADERIDFDGPYGMYYREIFFHMPFFIAARLNANQNFAEAQRWYHYIFNPMVPEPTQNDTLTHANDRYWQYRPFRNLSLKTLQQIVGNAEMLEAYCSEPFDPYLVAGVRINAYQKAVMMHYIDNLLNWGDSLFMQHTRESMGEALHVYMLCDKLLGQRPSPTPLTKQHSTRTYDDVRATHEEALSDFLVALEGQLPQTTRNSRTRITTDNNLMTDFPLVENQQFIKYWDRVEERLYQIRHGQNVEDVFRQLTLSQPEIDAIQFST